MVYGLKPSEINALMLLKPENAEKYNQVQ